MFTIVAQISDVPLCLLCLFVAYINRINFLLWALFSLRHWYMQRHQFMNTNLQCNIFVFVRRINQSWIRRLWRIPYIKIGTITGDNIASRFFNCGFRFQLNTWKIAHPYLLGISSFSVSAFISLFPTFLHLSTRPFRPTYIQSR